MDEERWRDVSGYEGLYKVSDQGRVYSVPRMVANRWSTGRPVPGKILKPVPDKDEYPKICLAREGTHKVRHIHSLVASAFLGERPEGLQVLHWDGNKENNWLSNLRYGTPPENGKDSIRLGERPCGEEVTTAKLTEAEVREIRERYGSVTCRELAEEYGVSTSNICQVGLRRTWKSVID